MRRKPKESNRHPHVTAYLGNGRWPECRFNIGDKVQWEEWAGKQTVVGINVLPNVSYVFAYDLMPCSQKTGSIIGHSVPEDELTRVRTQKSGKIRKHVHHK